MPRAGILVRVVHSATPGVEVAPELHVTACVQRTSARVDALKTVRGKTNANGADITFRATRAAKGLDAGDAVPRAHNWQRVNKQLQAEGG